MLRPDVVWFGELPYGLAVIEDAVVACDVFAAIGTSGQVYSRRRVRRTRGRVLLSRPVR
jgi:NAD-dependent SIR2 family protein deacetylase